jgi:hypothetical protein
VLGYPWRARPKRRAAEPSSRATPARRRAAATGEPVLGSVAAGAGPFKSVPSTDPPRTSVGVLGAEVVVPPVIALPERVDEVLAACSVVVDDEA